MTAAALNLPIAAGGVVLEYTGNALHWGFARYMRAPLAHTAILAMLTLTSMAASNALYNQRQHHPSPLFAPFQQAREVEPVIPADRPERPAAAAEPVAALETTGSVSVAPVLSLGNAEVTEIQRKLHSMQAIRAANHVLQTADPSGINAAGPGSNVGQSIVYNYAGEILRTA